MKSCELKKRCKDYLEKLITETKKERSNDSILEYLDFCSRFHGYSFNNTLLIWTARPGATRVAGFKTWQEMGRRIKKGEKGIPILAPMKIKTRQEDTIEDDEAKEETVIFKVVYVWDVSQTEGRPLPEAPDTISVEGSISGLLFVLETVIRSQGIEIEYVTQLSRGYGMSAMGHIKVLSTLNDEEKFHVLTHEFAHELLHGPQERVHPVKSPKGGQQSCI